MKNDKTMQAKRMIFMLKRFQGGFKYTAAEMQAELREQNLGDMKLRTVQRDLLLLSESEPLLERNRVGRTIIWSISKENFRKNLNLLNNEIFSLYLLKAHLKSFKGTFIESELEKVLDSLETVIPSDIFIDKNLFWDKNIGSYNYAEHDKIIRKIIDAVVYKKRVEIEYNRAEKGTIKKYNGIISKIFTYAGYLYTATYLPAHKTYIAMAVHRINNLRELFQDDIEVPEFNYEEFTALRFGVYSGKPERIEITIGKEFKKYFINRYWHSTQQLSDLQNGDMKLTMIAPISPDLIAWIMSWGEGIKSAKPSELKSKLIAKHKASLKNLQE